MQQSFRGTFVAVMVIWLIFIGQIRPTTTWVTRDNLLSPMESRLVCDACEFRRDSIVFRKGKQIASKMIGDVADLYRSRWRELGMLYYSQPVVLAKNRYDDTVLIYTFEKGVVIQDTEVKPYVLDWSLFDSWCKRNGIKESEKMVRPPGRTRFISKLSFYDALAPTVYWG